MKSGLPELFNIALANQGRERPISLLPPQKPYMIATALATSILRDGMVALLRRDSQPPRIGNSRLERGGINGRGHFDVLTQEGVPFMLDGPLLDYTLKTEDGEVVIRLASSAYPGVGLPTDSLVFALRIEGVGEFLHIYPQIPNEAIITCEAGPFSEYFSRESNRPLGTKDARMYLAVLNRLKGSDIKFSQGNYVATPLDEATFLSKGGSKINA